MTSFHLIRHPLIDAQMTCLRATTCDPAEFKRRVKIVAALMVPEVTKDLETRDEPCLTPLEETTGLALQRGIVLVPILRAGLGLLDGFWELMPDARVAHIGLARNEKTLQAEHYYLKYHPSLAGSDVIILDPMLATGGSAVEAIRTLKDHGVKSIRFVCMVAVPEGISNIEQAHPDVPIYAAALDRQLNERGYILPGLGDAGDRIFGTVE